MKKDDMGYKSRIYVVQKTIVKDENGMYFGMDIAAFEIRKFPEIIEKLNNCNPTDTYFYADDGETKITKDEYSNPLIEIPVKDMIHILRNLSNFEDERRYKPISIYLDALTKLGWENLVVLYYGC